MPKLTFHDALLLRANTFQDIRAFFSHRDVPEVDVPVLSKTCVSDPFNNSFSTAFEQSPFFLQSSPEYLMKRALAQAPVSMYYLGKAFRVDPVTPKHNPEFTMLEWYRIGWTDKTLMAEVAELLAQFLPHLPINSTSYGALFESTLGVNPHTCSVAELAELAQRRLSVQWHDEPRTTWLDVLFSHCIEPTLEGITFVYDYPACQSALAKQVVENGQTVAKRFEVFVDGVELANGYWELTDAQIQRARFEEDNAIRRQQGLPEVALDHALIAALEQGLPECAGVALGVDRLLMLVAHAETIAEVMPFSVGHM